MKIGLAAIGIAALLSACANEPIKKEKIEKTPVEGIVKSMNNEMTSASGTALGSALGPAYGLLYGVAMAKGCTAMIAVEGQTIKIRRPGDFCSKTKEGDRITLIKVSIESFETGRVISIAYQ